MEEDDFVQYRIDYTLEKSELKVEALINGFLKTSLIVDTGASLVILPQRLVKRLYLKAEYPLELILADGRKVKAKGFFLGSIKVGEVELRDIQAAVLEEEVLAVGLLGMSFLKNFLLKIDPRNQKLILERFKL